MKSIEKDKYREKDGTKYLQTSVHCRWVAPSTINQNKIQWLLTKILEIVKLNFKLLGPLNTLMEMCYGKKMLTNDANEIHDFKVKAHDQEKAMGITNY